MPYTNKSLTLVWLFILALFVMSASGWVSGLGLAVLVAAALSAPLILTPAREASHAVGRMARLAP